MASCGALAALLFGMVVGSSARAAGPVASLATVVPRFHLFPALSLPTSPEIGTEGEVRAEERPLRLPGDPDSLFTLGAPVPSGQLRLMAAFEVNDVVLRALTPDPWISSDDPRGRPQGTYSPIDVAGRPYQLRLGARLVW